MPTALKVNILAIKEFITLKNLETAVLKKWYKRNLNEGFLKAFWINIIQ